LIPTPGVYLAIRPYFFMHKNATSLPTHPSRASRTASFHSARETTHSAVRSPAAKHRPVVDESTRSKEFLANYDNLFTDAAPPIRQEKHLKVSDLF